MVQTKKMNESFFAQLLKDLNVAGELIRSRQDEKQALLNEFDSECKRFFFGKISEKALASSVTKTNKELQRLDFEIRTNITKARGLENRTAKLTSDQAPHGFRATLSGITGGNQKKKVVRKKPKSRKKKRVVKKKIPKKKRVMKKKTTRKK